MRSKRRLIFLMLFLIACGVLTFIKTKNSNNVSGLQVTKWNNFYEGKNINFYYGSSDKNVLNDISRRYSVESMYNKGDDELNKSLNILNWIKENIKYDKKATNHIDNKGVFDILGDMDKKKSYSNIQICKIYNEFCIASGMVSRIGKFVLENKDEPAKKDDFYICEVWNDKYKKWIMLDPCNRVHTMKDGKILSAVEVIENGLNNIAIVGNENYKQYIKDIKKYCKSYTIPIDNTVYSSKQSNSYVRFVKDENLDNMCIKNGVKYPVIFTQNMELLKMSPNEKEVEFKTDEIPTMIFSKDSSKDESKSEKSKDDIKLKLWLGVFENSYMLNKYYVSINNSTFNIEKNYISIPIKEGINNIKLSLDGKHVIREIEFKYIK